MRKDTSTELSINHRINTRGYPMIKKITAKNFKKYGWVIEYPGKIDKSKSQFDIILTENKKVGWRIAYLIERNNYIDKLEQHPDSFESFEPVKGKALIFLTNKKDLKTVECFYLDKPVILDKSVWHNVLTLTKESEIKITENAQVKCIYWNLDRVIRP